MRLIDLFDRAASLYSGNVFLQQDGVVRRYSESWQTTHRVAAAFQREGLGAGDAVGFLMPNDWRGIEALYGAFRGGHPVVPLNARNPVAYHLDQLRAAEARGLLFHSRFEAEAREAMARDGRLECLVCLDRELDGIPSLQAWMAPEGVQVETAAVTPESPWAIFGTSGTTGKSKHVVQTQLTSIALAWDMLFALRAHDPVRHLVVAPVSHFAGSFLFALTGVGSSHVLHADVDPGAILETIQRERIQILFLPPTVIRLLMDHPDRERYDLGSLRALIYAGAPMTRADVMRALDVFGPVLMNMLGQTEANGPITFLRQDEYRPDDGEDWAWRLLSIGRPSITRQVEIMDDAGQLLGPGEVGEVVIRGWGNSAGYIDNPEANAELMRHGWLHTGDVGIKDAEGYIVLVDRKKDMIISGGFNVFSAEVEQVLESHPGVVAAAVIGVPDEKWGEAVKAVVETAPDTSVTEAELIALCRTALGSVKAPKSVEFMQQLPRNPAGKLLKRELREPYWQGKERSI